MTTTSPSTTNPRRGEVWLIEFDPSVGSEIQKTRPALVLSMADSGRGRLRIVVPITSLRPGHPQADWLIRLQATPLNGLDRDSVADAFQVKCLALERFRHRIGRLEAVFVHEVAAAVAYSIGLEPS